MADWLLTHGANAKAKNGWTQLHWASHGGHKDIVALLLEHKADANAKLNSNNYPPLHWAAESGHAEIAKLLLARGADVNAKTNEDCTPLY